MDVTAQLNCSSLATNISINIDANPYISDKNYFFGTVPSIYKSYSIKCWSYVKSMNGEMQQFNPQKNSYSKAFLSLSKQIEDREYFISQNGVVNAYFTQKNLVAYTSFVLGVMCVNDNDGVMYSGEKCVTPEYGDLKGITARSAWAVENMDMLIILFIFGIVVLWIIIMFVRRMRKGFR